MPWKHDYSLPNANSNPYDAYEMTGDPDFINNVVKPLLIRIDEIRKSDYEDSPTDVDSGYLVILPDTYSRIGGGRIFGIPIITSEAIPEGAFYLAKMFNIRMRKDAME